ncbi:MAG: hypothetical protein SGPRY_014832 [Prymnesium sp.]
MAHLAVAPLSPPRDPISFPFSRHRSPAHGRPRLSQSHATENNRTFVELSIISVAKTILFPAGPENASCNRPPSPARPAPSPALSPPVCTAPAFTGALRPPDVRPRIVYMVLFSFEADLLEVLLHEIAGVVHKLVLVEAPYVHQRTFSKPFLWPKLARQPRFSKFEDLIHYFQVPSQQPSSDIWHGERQAMRAGSQEISDMARSWGLKPYDMIIMASVDEILSRATLINLRRCEVKGPVIAGGVWMPMGALDRAFLPDWSVGGRQYAFAPPTTYTFGKFEEMRRNYREKGTGPEVGRMFVPPNKNLYVLGGIHLTDSPLPALSILKDLTATEYHSRHAIGKMKLASTIAGANELQVIQTRNSKYASRFIPIHKMSPFEREVVFIPWYLGCNKARFPYMFGKPDPRNEQLARVLQGLLGS